MEEKPEIFAYNMYIIDQKLLSIRDTYIIRDENGQELGRATRKILSLGPKVIIKDKQDNEVGRIEGKFISLRREMKFIDWKGEVKGIMKRKLLKFIGSEYWIETPQGERIYTIKGKFTKHNYKIIDDRTNKVVAEVGKKWISLRDSYAVKIYTEDFDPFLAVCIPIAIDVAEHPGK